MRSFRLVYCISMAFCAALIVLIELDEAGWEEAVASVPAAPDEGERKQISAFDDFATVLPGLHRYNESEHFMFWTTLDEPEPSWITLAEDSVGYVCWRLGVKPALSKAAVFFVGNREEVRRLGVHLHATGRGSTAYYLSRVPAIVILVSSDVAGSIIHETTHHVVEGVAAGLPPGIDEGIATLVTGELTAINGEFAATVERAKATRARRLAGVQDLPFLKELVTMSYDEFHEEEGGYQLSWCLAKILLDREAPRPQRLTEFFEGFDRTDPWGSFVRTYPVEKIESEWEAEFFRQRSGK